MMQTFPLSPHSLGLGHDSSSRLDLAKLAQVKPRGGGRTGAACPACREAGGDRKGQHLMIFPDGRFACAAHQGDREHAVRILQLAGVDRRGPLPPRQPFPQPAPDQPPEALDWAADAHRLTKDASARARAAAWRGYDRDFVDLLARTGALGLTGGRLCLPVADEAGLGTVRGRHVFSWPEERLGDHGKADAWFAPAGVKPLPPLWLGHAGPDTGTPTEVCLCESQWDALALLQGLEWRGGPRARPFVITRGTSPTAALTEALAGVEIVWLWMQRDAPKADGSIPAEEWLRRCLTLLPESVHTVRRIDPPAEFKDWNDALRGMPAAAFQEAMTKAREAAAALSRPFTPESSLTKDAPTPPPGAPPSSSIHLPSSDPAPWPAPRPLPSNLAPVPVFDTDRLLPHTLRGYVHDCTERLQVDASFVAVPLIVALGAVVGNRLGLRPKVHDDWTEYPNVWGAIIGRPSALKSPALAMALRPLKRLEAAANATHAELLADWRKDNAAAEITRAAAKARATAAARKGLPFDPAELICGDSLEEPACRRFLTNDATLEALHAVLCKPVNATGVLIFADELSGLLSRLNDADRGGALRAFMLSAWSGHQAAVVDRVGRGENLRVDRCCVSVLGGIQPGKLAPLVDGALRESIQDDGWLQRLSLLVWPDAPAEFELIDRVPDGPAFEDVQRLFDRAEATAGPDWPGAVPLEDDRALNTAAAATAAPPSAAYLRLTPEAAGLFRDWLEQETTTLRRSELPAALESHFMKYRKTVCALALLFHLAGDPDEPAVPLIALLRAFDWIEYLKAHAQRVYGAHKNNTAETAGRVLAKLKSGELAPTFTARQLKQKEWSGLRDNAATDAALAMLVEHGWLREVEVRTPGRHTAEYISHPSAIAEVEIAS